MSQDAQTTHPFDREDGPRVIDYRGSKVALRPEPSNEKVSRETIESIKRTLYNAIDKLDRIASE